jgi:hypothetical protein
MKEPEPQYQILSDYLDDQLDEAERAKVESLLKNDQAAAEYLADLKRLRAKVGQLPRFDLGDDFADTVLRQAEQEMLTGGRRTAKLIESRQESDSASRSADHSGTSRLRRYISSRAIGWSAAVILVAILVSVYETDQAKQASSPERETVAMKMRGPVDAMFVAPKEPAAKPEQLAFEAVKSKSAPVTEDRDTEPAKAAMQAGESKGRATIKAVVVKPDLTILVKMAEDADIEKVFMDTVAGLQKSGQIELKLSYSKLLELLDSLYSDTGSVRELTVQLADAQKGLTGLRQFDRKGDAKGKPAVKTKPAVPEPKKSDKRYTVLLRISKTADK